MTKQEYQTQNEEMKASLEGLCRIIAIYRAEYPRIDTDKSNDLWKIITEDVLEGRILLKDHLHCPSFELDESQMIILRFNPVGNQTGVAWRFHIANSENLLKEFKKIPAKMEKLNYEPKPNIRNESLKYPTKEIQPGKFNNLEEYVVYLNNYLEEFNTLYTTLNKEQERHLQAVQRLVNTAELNIWERDHSLSGDSETRKKREITEILNTPERSFSLIERLNRFLLPIPQEVYEAHIWTRYFNDMSRLNKISQNDTYEEMIEKLSDKRTPSSERRGHLGSWLRDNTSGHIDKVTFNKEYFDKHISAEDKERYKPLIYKKQ